MTPSATPARGLAHVVASVSIYLYPPFISQSRQMYTANTMASAIEALGMTIPGSSSFPAESQEKHDECAAVGPVMRNLLEKNILPRQIMTRSAFENAMVRVIFYTPVVLTHLSPRS